MYISTFYKKIETKSKKFFYLYQNGTQKTIYSAQQKKKEKRELKKIQFKIQTTRIYSVSFWYKCDNRKMECEINTQIIFVIIKCYWFWFAMRTVFASDRYYRNSDFDNAVPLYWNTVKKFLARKKLFVIAK